MSWQEEVDAIRARREIALGMGGPERVARQHDQGRLTIRERIDGLVDKGSFTEIGQIAGTGTYHQGTLASFVPEPYVAGLATIRGRDTVVAGEDFTVRGGSGSGPGKRNKRDMAFAMARQYRVPMVLRVRGRVFAVENRCPHLGFQLDGGDVRGRTITCPAHGRRFDLISGRCKSEPGQRTRPLVTMSTWVDSGTVWLAAPRTIA